MGIFRETILLLYLGQDRYDVWQQYQLSVAINVYLMTDVVNSTVYVFHLMNTSLELTID